MATPREDMIITYEGHNGVFYDICGGDNEGLQGIRLATDSHGTAWEDLYEAQIETIYNSTAFEIGGRYGGLREHMLEFTLAFHVKATHDRAWRINDSRFRKAMSFKKDSKLRVKIVGESERWLTVRLKSTPKLKVQVDPNNLKYGLLLVPFVASYPRWMEDDYTEPKTTATDTRTTGTETLWFHLSNPTNNEVWVKWVLQAGNAGIVYTMPDWSQGDDRFDLAEEHEDRMVIMPALLLNEHVVVDTDEMTMSGQVNSSLDTQVYQRMNGREFLYPLPAYMEEVLPVPVVVAGADIGNVVQLRIPRSWSRPWGLE
jgi:hypothetical protein